jgi:hypothetical protein
VLSELGLVYKLDLIGMVAERLNPPTRPLPDVRLRRIDNEETRLALADLNADSYGVPREWGRQAIGGAALWQNQLEEAFLDAIGPERGHNPRDEPPEPDNRK